jgi:phosphoglycerate dehydrogenase-like enzyme
LEVADVAFGYPDAEAAAACEKLCWVHLNSAGYTSYDRGVIKGAFAARGAVLTNSSCVYDEPCAQHLLAMMLSLARQLPAALDAQRGDRSWPMLALRSSSKLLNGQTVLLLGYGAIARRFAELLKPLGMSIMAVRRQVSGTESIPVRPVSDVDELLAWADHVVNILPANDATQQFLNETRLSKLKTGAIVYNIGRGATLDQHALLNQLRSGRIAAAYLDVTDPEPLPPDHPLWTTPNCFITPHSAGGHADEKLRQVQHFLENLRRFENNEPLLNRIL